MTILFKIFLLFAGHALCDYPLQRDFLARGKNHTAAIPGVPWYQCLFAHALIHGGMVLLITRSTWLAFAELVIHFGIDFTKCSGKLSFNQDQALHYACKVAWAIL